MEQSNPSTTSVAPSFVLGVCVAVGLILAGYFVAAAVMESRRADRTVTAIGVAEQTVDANFAVWEISYAAEGATPQALQESLLAGRRSVVQFLEAHGFPQAEISVLPPRNIAGAELAAPGVGAPGAGSLKACGVVLLQTRDLAKVAAALQNAGDLLGQGVLPCACGQCAREPSYKFRNLAELVPALLTEASRDAKKSANRMVEETGASVGAIRSAKEYPAEILDLEPRVPQKKIVRVQTMVEFLLE